jgi:hypothetical protein
MTNGLINQTKAHARWRRKYYVHVSQIRTERDREKQKLLQRTVEILTKQPSNWPNIQFYDKNIFRKWHPPWDNREINRLFCNPNIYVPLLEEVPGLNQKNPVHNIRKTFFEITSTLPSHPKTLPSHPTTLPSHPTTLPLKILHQK